MSKEYEKIRTEVSKQYKAKISELEKENKELKIALDNTKQRLVELEDELNTKNEWIERMQAFCNMTDEERDNYIETETSKQQAYKSMNILAVGLGRSFNFKELL